MADVRCPVCGLLVGTRNGKILIHTKPDSNNVQCPGSNRKV